VSSFTPALETKTFLTKGEGQEKKDGGNRLEGEKCRKKKKRKAPIEKRKGDGSSRSPSFSDGGKEGGREVSKREVTKKESKYRGGGGQCKRESSCR